MEFYQVHYGGGEWEDSWENISGLYTTKEKANDYIVKLGFKWTEYPSGRYFWEQQEEYDGLSYTPHWVKIETVKVVD